MRNVRAVYTEYNIMPSLQLHQLRVAAVAKLICQGFSSEGGSASGGQKPVDERVVVLACLFHDMGNIIKSDLKYFPEFIEPKGLKYWEKVKREFISKFGPKPHEANVAIAEKIGLPDASVVLIDSISFSKLAEVVADDSHERKIMQYADLRVGPHGILPLTDRIAEGRKRYNTTRTERSYYESDEGFGGLARAAEELEKQVFAGMRLKPEDVTDTSIAQLIEELWEYTVG